jgi:ketosteroid isomerase-like protein
MKKVLTTKQLLETYYEGFAKKQGWESVISEDFKYIGGGMTNTTPTIGKQAYIEVIKRFSKLFTAMRVKEIIAEENRACVIGNYDFVFPTGKSINANVAKIWKIKDGKLDSLTIYFDTLGFENFSKV